ncbi:MAG: peptidyl-prolyl cis-trans isomerase [Lachnospiraceae bacterium]|nr:peptidyl-prolyl cis-trans isomerase [Lachnospiraceae bacterium]
MKHRSEEGQWLEERCRKPGALLCGLVLFLSLILAGCGQRTSSSLSEAKGRTLEQPELMVIVATERNRYEQIYTDQIWNVAVDAAGTTFQDYLLEQIKLFVTDLQVIGAMAEEYGISLDSGEKEQLRRLSQDYYSQLSEGDKAYMGAAQGDVLELYEKYHLASKTVTELTKNADLEISDSEAKVIEIQKIVLEDAQTAQSVWEQVTAEGADFAAVAESVSAEETVQEKLGRGEDGTGVEEAAFSLEKDAISPVIESDGKYYILKCINDYDQDATLQRKEELSLLRKDKAFRSVYDSFLAEHPVTVPEEIWQGISCETEADTSTTNFFELYKEYFPE